MAESILFFWKWPRSHQIWARDGQPHYLTGVLPEREQDKPKIKEDRLKMKEKLDKVRSCMYIKPGIFFSPSHIFYVSKGLNNIRMVYNISSFCLNSVLSTPNFGLPVA